ncbi:MAG: hypothetical protein K0R17_2696 [Rariglobus sp.]|jgi:hypothetical protein|nr:hypothetical protein [Rariglobus sp.]
MELNLQPLATSCYVTGKPFGEGERVLSFLVRNETSDEVMRYDVLESARESFTIPGFVACSWGHVFKPRKAGENPERELKLTAENLFVTLADPTIEIAPENERLVQFLALMLERKKLLRPKGRSADGRRNLFEHAKTKLIYAVPAGELNPEFFMSIQEQLSVLVGGGKKPATEAKPGEAGPAGDAPAAPPATA